MNEQRDLTCEIAIERADRRPSTLSLFAKGIGAIALIAVVSGCASQDPYEHPVAKGFDQEAADTIKQLEADGNGHDGFVYMQWAIKQSYIANGMMQDPTPDITPATVREAIAEERERNRREDEN